MHVPTSRSINNKSRRGADKKGLLNDFLAISHQYSENQELITNWFNKLSTCYESPTRHYHNLNHVVYILRLAQENRNLIDDWNSFFYATWFHDTIQKIGIDNESASAKYARVALTQLKVPTCTIEKCEALILATKHHSCTDCNSDTAFFIDCDIAILGEDPNKYDAYRTATRKEYSIPNLIYKYGRVKFLNKMIAKQNIFQTKHFRRLFEEPARRNINNELLALKN